MEKTKLGLPVNVLAAIAFLTVLFGGYIPALLVVGYILICESDAWLKKSALKALAVMLVFSLANAVIGLLPSLVEVFSSLFQIFGGYFSADFVNRVYYFVTSVLSLLKTLALLGLAAMAMFNKSIDVKPLDKLVD